MKIIWDIEKESQLPMTLYKKIKISNMKYLKLYEQFRLNESSDPFSGFNKIILFGPMASGKSSIGKSLSESLKIKLYDLDNEPEFKNVHKPVNVFGEMDRLMDENKDNPGVQKDMASGKYWLENPFNTPVGKIGTEDDIWRYRDKAETDFLEKFLKDHNNERCIVDCGGSMGIKGSKEEIDRLKKILEPYKNVFLIIPDEKDIEETVHQLRVQLHARDIRGGDDKDLIVKKLKELESVKPEDMLKYTQKQNYNPKGGIKTDGTPVNTLGAWYDLTEYIVKSFLENKIEKKRFLTKGDSYPFEKTTKQIIDFLVGNNQKRSETLDDSIDVIIAEENKDEFPNDNTTVEILNGVEHFNICQNGATQIANSGGQMTIDELSSEVKKHF